jgi:hypothetical protein
MSFDFLNFILFGKALKTVSITRVLGIPRHGRTHEKQRRRRAIDRPDEYLLYAANDCPVRSADTLNSTPLPPTSTCRFSRTSSLIRKGRRYLTKSSTQLWLRSSTYFPWYPGRAGITLRFRVPILFLSPIT